MRNKGPSSFKLARSNLGYFRVRVLDANVGRKLGYIEELDIISYFYLSQTNAQAALIAISPVMAELDPSPVEAEVTEAMAKPKRTRSKSKAPFERQV